MAWTSPKTFVAAEVLTASEMNTYVRDNTLAIVDAHPLIIPSARVYNDANISIAHNVITALTFNSERWDTDDIHSTVTNTSRLTCVTAGLYSVHGHVQFDSNNTGRRILQIGLNGPSYWAMIRQDAVQSVATGMSISTIVSLSVNDYVELYVYQNSGGSLNVVYNPAHSPEFGMTYLGKAN